MHKKRISRAAVAILLSEAKKEKEKSADTGGLPQTAAQPL